MNYPAQEVPMIGFVLCYHYAALKPRATHDQTERASDEMHAVRAVAASLSPTRDGRERLEFHLWTCDGRPEFTHAERLYQASLHVLARRLHLRERLACASELVNAITTCMALGETLANATIACITTRAQAGNTYPGWDKISEGRALILYRALIRVEP